MWQNTKTQTIGMNDALLKIFVVYYPECCTKVLLGARNAELALWPLLRRMLSRVADVEVHPFIHVRRLQYC